MCCLLQLTYLHSGLALWPYQAKQGHPVGSMEGIWFWLLGMASLAVQRVGPLMALPLVIRKGLMHKANLTSGWWQSMLPGCPVQGKASYTPTSPIVFPPP